MLIESEDGVQKSMIKDLESMNLQQGSDIFFYSRSKTIATSKFGMLTCSSMGNPVSSIHWTLMLELYCTMRERRAS